MFRVLYCFRFKFLKKVFSLVRNGLVRKRTWDLSQPGSSTFVKAVTALIATDRGGQNAFPCNAGTKNTAQI